MWKCRSITCTAAAGFEEAEREFKDILPLLSFLMISLEHLTCYGKRLTARRIGLAQVYDRGPAQTPTAFGLDVMRHWSRNLGMLCTS